MRAKGMAAALIVLALALAGTAAAKIATIKGYVLDSACAFTKNLDKLISRKCTLECTKAGSPLVIRKPNDNAHLERFNRTIQEECLRRLVPKQYPKALDRYVDFYNAKRLHLGINLKTPLQVVLSS